jgi:uracil-DNA glycosylase
MSSSLSLDERQRAMLLEMGVRVWLPGTAFTTAPIDAPEEPAPAPAPPTAPPLRAPVRPAAVPVTASPVASELASLDALSLANAAGSCQACGLCAGRIRSTLQAEPLQLQADWLVVGDPPDEDEDRSGKPFVEAAGLLLDNMLKAVGARRWTENFASDGAGPEAGGAHVAYVTNVVKCRPPHGRNPQPADLAQCARFLKREIELVRPKVIFAVGRFAIQTLLAEQGALASQPLGKLRGSVYRYHGVPVVVSYHPQLLLRNSADKAKAWADLCLAMDAIAGT